jgi:hypothetical protein
MLRFNFYHYAHRHPHLASSTIDKFFVRKKDAKAPPAPGTKVTSLALVRTWAQILFGVLRVTRCALGCILGVTVFSPYVKTVVEDCIDRILSVFRGMGVKLVKGGESCVDRGDKQPTESPTYNPWVYMFGKAVRLPIWYSNVLQRSS